MSVVSLYTDGACSGNPGPGGWAAILVYGEHEKALSGGEKDTTNQRMEIAAVVEGLKALTRPCHVKVYSDSAYVVNAFHQQWYVAWKRNGWRNSKNEPVKNRELWEALLTEVAKHKVEFCKVKGHSGHQYNERCDALAREAVSRLR
jgi:ribonuclease HI